MKSHRHVFFVLLASFAMSSSCNKDSLVEGSPQNVTPVFKYKRTACFGFCDAYEFILKSDNTACLEGMIYHNNLNSRINYRNNCTNVSTAIWKLIQRKALEMGLESMSNEYPEDGVLIPDLSTKFIELQLGSKSIQIKETYGAPAKLIEFENFVEKLIKDISVHIPSTNDADSALERNLNFQY